MRLPTVLLVEDEPSISDPLAEALGEERFSVEVVRTAAEALARAIDDEPDLVLLDLMLPDGDGRDVCREIRRRSDVPIIMLTARGDETDRIVGLEIGADDYVVKPFSSRELVARMRAILRRHGARRERSDGALTVGDVTLDPGARVARLGTEPLAMTAREFDLLHLLMRHAGTVVRREQIMDEVWDENWFGSTKTLDVHISWLRQKLGEGYITTIRGVGFRFDAPAR